MLFIVIFTSQFQSIVNLYSCIHFLDLSQYPGSAPSAVPVVEGHSCPTCHSPVRDGGICLCTPTVSKSHTQSSTVLRKKSRRRKQQQAAETAVTPSDSKSLSALTETQESQPQLRRQLFRPESTSNLGKTILLNC